MEGLGITGTSTVADVSAKLLVLRQVVGDREPWSLRANKDVCGRTNAWAIDQGAERDVNERSVADNRVEKRATLPAMHIVRKLPSEDEHAVCALRDA